MPLRWRGTPSVSLREPPPSIWGRQEDTANFLLGLLLLETANLILLGFFDNLEVSTNLGSLKWRELSAKLTEGVPARRRQRAQYIIAMQISRHHPSASLPPSSERRACRCPKFAQSQRLPPWGSCHEVTEGVSRPQATAGIAMDVICTMFRGCRNSCID